MMGLRRKLMERREDVGGKLTSSEGATLSGRAFGKAARVLTGGSTLTVRRPWTAV
jgi:hypothetical protein